MPETSDRGRWSLHDREHHNLETAHRREHETEEKARDLAAANIDHRLEGLNELRREVIEDRGQFVRRDTHASEMEAQRARHESDTASLTASVQALKERADRAEGALATWRFIALFMGLPGAIAFMLALVRLFGGEV